MKISFRVFYSILLFMIIFGCKKNIAAINTDTVIDNSINNGIVSFGVVGRQQVIKLSTGDHTYPVSQALLWIPHRYNKSDKKKFPRFPLIFNLYGQGQCGTDLNLMLQDSTMSAYIAKGFNATAVNPVDGKTYSFFVCSPQCPVSWGWSEPQVKYMIEQLKNKLPIDTSRIYITGFSSGGWGLWSCITDDDLARQFAAVIPISSASADHPDKITNVDKYGIACLNICGDQDAFYKNAVNYTNIINSNKPPIPATLNTLKGVGHSAWIYAYDNDWKNINGLNIYEWMLQYKKP